MSYALGPDHGNKLIRVVYSGIVTVAERTKAMQETFEAVMAMQIRRVLVDFREAEALPAADFESSKRFVDMLSKKMQGNSTRIAYLSENREPLDRVIDILCDGRIPLMRFTEEPEAIEWLCR